jgi:hypothetical protein
LYFTLIWILFQSAWEYSALQIHKQGFVMGIPQMMDKADLDQIPPASPPPLRKGG